MLNRKIASAVLAAIAGIINYAGLKIAESMCYYADIRDICYSSFPISRHIIEFVIIFSIVYFVTYYGLTWLHKRPKKK